jgi:peptidoglycan/LPS O-acetylase OafA/YrhL
VKPAGGDRIPALDGVRGIAILLVLFLHVVIYSGLQKSVLIDSALLAAGQAAWLGVDLFFVLSGFLITGILYDAKGSPQYFSSFYGRRVLRIFPLYYGFLACMYLVAPLLLTPEEAGALHAKQVWYWTYLANVDVALHGWPEPGHLGHFWTLAIEEQFYLIWPLVVLVCDRRRLMMICIACALIALMVRTAIPVLVEPLAAHVLLPTRVDTLAIGGLVALLMRAPAGRVWLQRWAHVILVIGAVWLCVLFFVRKGLSAGDPVVQTMGYSVIAVTSAALIATAVEGRGLQWLRRVLASPPLIFLGKYSYGLYVVHHPIIFVVADSGLTVDAFPQIGGSSIPGVLAFGAVTVSLSIGTALISWHLWEAPFLRLKKYLPYRNRRAVVSGRARVAGPAKAWIALRRKLW